MDPYKGHNKYCCFRSLGSSLDRWGSVLPTLADRQILAEPKHVSQTMPSFILRVTESTDIQCCAHWWVKSAKMGQLPLCVNAYWNMQWNRNKTWQLPAVLVPKNQLSHLVGSAKS